jgi:hypothetical protein
MKKKEVITIMVAILTLIIAEIFLFYQLYNQFFQIQVNQRENPYILLRNGKYFELECENDVIDNKTDFSLKPFGNKIEKSLDNKITKLNQACATNNGSTRETTIEKGREDLKISHKIFLNGKETEKNSYYYTHLDYPIIPAMKNYADRIEISDSNCIVTIQKNREYEYILLNQSIRIGKEYSEVIDMEINMNIKCL